MKNLNTLNFKSVKNGNLSKIMIFLVYNSLSCIYSIKSHQKELLFTDRIVFFTGLQEK